MLKTVLHGVSWLVWVFAAAGFTLSQDNGGDTATPPARQQDYYVEAFVSDEMPYVGEQILYAFRYFAYTLPPDLQDNLPEFEGFWLADVYELTGSRVETIGNRQYIVGELYAEISPLNAGRITIPPSSLVVPPSVFNEGADLQTEAVVLRVQPLPEGAPESFNGAIGQFNADREIDRTTLTLGEPIEMTITIDGTGNLERLPAPDLSNIPGWRTYTNPARYVVSNVGGLRLGQKVFEWLLIPTEAGTKTFPAIEFTYFDPESAEYRTTTFDAFAVDVFPGADNAIALPSVEQFAEDSDDIVPLLTVTNIFTGQANAFTPLFWMLWAVPPLLTLTAGLWVFQAHYRQNRRLRLRRLNALRVAAQRLKAAQNTSAQVASLQIMQAIYGYIADKTGTIADPSNYTQILREGGVSEPFIETLAEALNEADAGRYTPPGVEKDMRPVIAQTMTTLNALDTVWMG